MPAPLAHAGVYSVVHALAIAILRPAVVVGHGIEPQKPNERVKFPDAVLEGRAREAPPVYPHEGEGSVGGLRAAGLDEVGLVCMISKYWGNGRASKRVKIM